MRTIRRFSVIYKLTICNLLVDIGRLRQGTGAQYGCDTITIIFCIEYIILSTINHDGVRFQCTGRLILILAITCSPYAVWEIISLIRHTEYFVNEFLPDILKLICSKVELLINGFAVLELDHCYHRTE